MTLFKEPEHSYTDFFDRARYTTTWKLTLYLFYAFFFLSVFYAFNYNAPYGKQDFIVSVLQLLLTILALITLLITRNYYTVTYSMMLLIYAFVWISIFMVNLKPDVIEFQWIINVIIFAYFKIRSKKIGNILLISSIGIYLFYIYFGLNDTLVTPRTYSNYELLGLVFEFVLSMTVVGFYIHNFVKNNAAAEKGYREANEELNKQYRMIRLQNEEKTLLLKEIHHRVKNNLQVITSLLRLQSSEIESEDTKGHFNDAINRMMTMSLIHQKMYHEKSLAQIDPSDYFKTLIDDLIGSSSVKIPVDIDVVSNIENVGSKTIVPLALLISELVSNSLKHAFNDFGKISVYFSAEKDSLFTVEYLDNGNWKPQSGSSSFGLQLIDTLCDQLDGKYTRTSTPEGTKYSFILTNIDV
jgi:two-component sensor histidine kinase